jgi:hypothetical protein
VVATYLTAHYRHSLEESEEIRDIFLLRETRTCYFSNTNPEHAASSTFCFCNSGLNMVQTIADRCHFVLLIVDRRWSWDGDRRWVWTSDFVAMDSCISVAYSEFVVAAYVGNSALSFLKSVRWELAGWLDNHVGEVGCECVYWIIVAEDRVQWWSLVNSVTILWVPKV